MRTSRQVTTPTAISGGQARPPIRFLAMWLCLSAFAAACSSSGSGTDSTTSVAPTTTAPDTTTTPPDTGPGPAPLPPVPVDPPSAPGLLAVVDGRDLLVMNSDGTEPMKLSADNSIASQPAWSPDGQRLAWIELGSDGPFLVTALPDGSDRRSRPAGFGPFYVSWSPDAQRVATLGGTADGSGVNIAFLTLDDEPDFLAPADSAEGYFFSWATNSESVVAHAGGTELRGTTADGERSDVLASTSEAFGVPLVLPDGRVVFAQNAAAGGSEIVISDVSSRGNVPEPIATFQGTVGMVLDSTGTQLAVLALGGGGSGFSPVSFAPAANRQEPELPELQDGITVLDLTTQAIVFADEEPALAAAFSPDGSQLAILGSDGQGGGFWKITNFADVAGISERFRPSLLYTTTVLPFFDQYATSTTPWAPDGSALAFAASDDVDDTPSIWVQDVDTTLAPYRIADGGYVVWQPVAA